MNRVDRIIRHPEYLDAVKQVKEYEKTRIFCCHQPEHFLDVARIAYILNLEESLNIDKEIIYAAALLHDIGRYVHYEDGTPHEKASALIAPKILEDCGFDERERDIIVAAILAHRDWTVAQKTSLSSVIYRADKASRACFSCDAETLCDWKAEKKNLEIRY